MKSALTIAGSDCTGGAGLQADLRVFGAFGLHGFAVPAALTAQSTEGVSEIQPVEGSFFQRQLEVLLEDVTPGALKTGMLYTKRAVEVTARAVREHGLKNLVVDPVTVSSSGTALLEEGALDLLRERLFPLARVITPNIYEASLLSGTNIESPEEMERGAKELRETGAKVVVITGGHLEGGITLDLFYDGEEVHRLESEKLPGEYHGTGCAFSAAVAALLALGRAPLTAAWEGKKYVQEAIRKAHYPGRGMGILRL